MYVDTLSDSGMGCDNTPVHKYSTVYKEIIHGVCEEEPLENPASMCQCLVESFPRRVD